MSWGDMNEENAMVEWEESDLEAKEKLKQMKHELGRYERGERNGGMGGEAEKSKQVEDELGRYERGERDGGMGGE